ncbi:hypothetical protein FBY35_2656 [Streptomyces sp. SLBN-118]|nr:hypothetical protein FBY35_2656 [Streptomyces sp. SLBN-118]
MSRTLSAGFAFLLAGTVAVGGVSGCGSSGGEGPDKPGPTVTSTRTVTVQPPSPASPKPTVTLSPTSRKRTVSPTRDAASTVEDYFAAINARDYRRAWDLGGRSLGGSYSAFRSGFAETSWDTVHIVGVRGGTVTVTLDALQTDGTVRSFAGTYTVRDGVIVDADISPVAGPTSESYPPGPPAGIPDVDCSDLPGPVWVGPDDPHDLDRDGDGIGCDAN